MKTYEVTLHRVVEHTTTFRVEADDIDEASDLVLSGTYDEVIQDSEEGEMEDPEVTSIEQV
jgi:hypothetical protein